MLGSPTLMLETFRLTAIVMITDGTKSLLDGKPPVKLRAATISAGGLSDDMVSSPPMACRRSLFSRGVAMQSRCFDLMEMATSGHSTTVRAMYCEVKGG